MLSQVLRLYGGFSPEEAESAEPGREEGRGGIPAARKSRVAVIPFPVPAAKAKGFFNKDPFGHCRIGRLTGAHRCVPIPLQHCPFRTLRPASSNKTSTAPGPRCLCEGAWLARTGLAVEMTEATRSPPFRKTSPANGDKPVSSDEAWRARQTRQTGSPRHSGPSCSLEASGVAQRQNHRVSASLKPLRGDATPPRPPREPPSHSARCPL
jgi:hypothetical protein